MSFRLVDGLLGHLQTQKLQPAVDVPDAVVIVLTLARIVRFLVVLVLLLRHRNLLLSAAAARNSTHRRGQVDRRKKLRLLLTLLLQLLQKLLLMLVRGNVVQRMPMVHKVGTRVRRNVRRLLLGWWRRNLLLRLPTVT